MHLPSGPKSEWDSLETTAIRKAHLSSVLKALTFYTYILDGYAFHGLTEDIIKQSLLILQKQDKCEIIGEDGVKFF